MMHTCLNPPLSRRATLLGLGSVIALNGVSLAVAAAATDQRFVVILLRGALDGLSAVAPYGDPGLMALRPELVAPPPGQEKGLLDLGGMYGLHPALARSHEMFKANELLIVHAVAGNYRMRSHFDAQDCLESGANHRMTSGWLNRAAAALSVQSAHPLPKAIAIGPSIPLLLRGTLGVANWAPHGFGEPPPTLYQAILNLNRSDPLIGPAIAAGLRDRGFGAAAAAGLEKGAGRFAFAAFAKAAGEMLRAPNGPRIAALELGGWDTHAGQINRIAPPLTQLDNGLAALKEALGDVWGRTVVLVMTEFGRTARMNGTNGTDHGTATVAFVAGGAVAGGRVVANWPGLARDQLFEDRDLAPTTDIRAVAKGILSGHLGLNPAALKAVFPESEPAQAMAGLVRAA